MRNNWRQAAVTYQIYPRTFTDDDGDSLGALIDQSFEALAGVGFPVEQAPAQGLEPMIGRVRQHSSDQRQ